ncbi:MAG: hypothetical protein V3T84_06285 [Phycisphaerales bacterium]
MKFLTALVFTATGLAAFNALGQSDRYVFDIIAEADPGGPNGFVSILSASMNTEGAVAFAAIAAGETVPAVFFTPDEPCDIDTDVNVCNAVGPVLNNDGWIVFLALDDEGGIIGISRYNPGSVPVSVHDAGDEVLGGIASTSGDPPDYIAYWSACLDPRACGTIEQCVVVIDSDGAEQFSACDDFPAAQLSAPAINGDFLSYVRAEERSEDRTLVLLENLVPVDPPPLVISSDGLLTPPTINAGGTVAVFCEDPDHQAGIYTVTDLGADLLEPLDGDKTPALNTRPFINSNGAVAYTAIEDDKQTVFAQNDVESVAVIAEGDILIEDPRAGAVVTLDIFARKGCQILFAAGLDDDGDDLVDRTILVRARYKFDLDNDGTVGATDLVALLAAWGTDPGGPPDFDGDGIVGSSDLLSLLVNWGPCP